MNFPPGYQTLDVREISHIGYQPDRKQALIWVESTVGLKVCLVIPLAMLSRAIQEIHEDAFNAAGQPATA